MPHFSAHHRPPLLASPLFRLLGWSLKLFRVRGILLSLHFSFFALLGYVAWAGWQGSPADGDPGGWESAAWYVATFLVFFGCVVLHELGHCFMAMRFGVGVRRILLLPIGGMAEFDDMPREPARELAVALAGPAVNFAIVGVLWGLLGVPDQWSLVDGSYPNTWRGFLQFLGHLNLFMGLFNLVPVFPMDGGRMLRALLALKLPYVRATLVAATIAKILAVAAIVMAVTVWEAPMLAALFTFIFVVGEIEYRAVLRREREEAHWREVFARFQETPPAEEEPPVVLR